MITTETLTSEFERHKPPLKSFLLRMTRSVEDTEDLIQDTYLKAHQNLAGFRGDSSLKTWLFSIASNLAKDHLRSKKLWPENVTDICRDAALSNHAFLQKMMTLRITSPQGNFEVAEHITFCFTCISKSLSIEQQLTLLLKEVYEFKVIEIAQILDKTEAMIKYYLHTGRRKMIDIFDRRCALINKQGVCHQCSELNGIFNPKQKFQEENHENRNGQGGIRAIDPFSSGASELQLAHLKHNKDVMDNHLKEN